MVDGLYLASDIYFVYEQKISNVNVYKRPYIVHSFVPKEKKIYDFIFWNQIWFGECN